MRPQPGIIPENNPHRGEDGKPEPANIDPLKNAREVFDRSTKNATQDLMEFLSTLQLNKYPLCVTYFDEAHELKLCFWILLRLLYNQDSLTKMWYVFIGTKSNISYYAPSPGQASFYF